MIDNKAKQYLLDMLELNELLAQDTILSDVIEEGRLDVKDFGNKLKDFQNDFEHFVRAKNKFKQDYDKIMKEQLETLKEIKKYKKLYHYYYKDGQNDDADKVDDDLAIGRLITYEIVVKQHMMKLREIAEKECWV